MAFEPDDKWTYGASAEPEPEPDPGSAWPPPADRQPGRRPPLKKRGAHDLEANGNGSGPYEAAQTGSFDNPRPYEAPQNGSYGGPGAFEATQTGSFDKPEPYGYAASPADPAPYGGDPAFSQEPPLFGGSDEQTDGKWSQFNDRPLSFNDNEPLFLDPDPEPDPSDTTRLSTGRFTSPSLGAYDSAKPASADNGSRLQGDDGYFDEYGYGKEFGDGNLELEDDVDLEAEEAELTAMSAARRNGIEWAVVLVGAVLLALILRAVLLQAFWIPSPSMESTLLVRDRVLVNKVSYRLHDIHRGDVVVFRRTDAEIAANPTLPQDVIKRVIALEGEVIEIRDNTVFIDGGELLEPYLDEGIVTNDFGPEEVPAGHIFVMGDNRGLSSDSRFETGPVAHDRVVGRAFFLFWPLNRMGAL